MNINTNRQRRFVPLSRSLLNFIVILLGMAAAYFTTIGSIKIQLAEKAESALVEKIDKRLGRLEVTIIEGTISKDEFCQFRNSIESRLTRIEYFLVEHGR
ncbi:MAG: hypothetical protein JSU69_09860 [Candidatus Zixiibacteriota bacterium]|nr:MAG: hypothetical protein JSU69_09860 [candidate division Zixibacteria bacterium]